MLKISTKGQYGLLLMTTLAKTAESNPQAYTPLKSLAHSHNISARYAEQIVNLLKKNELLDVLRGNSGGYKLNRSARDYTAGEILRAMEGDLNPKGDLPCHPVTNSGNIDFWKGFEQSINSYVDGITLEQIVQRSKADDSYIYVI